MKHYFLVVLMVSPLCYGRTESAPKKFVQDYPSVAKYVEDFIDPKKKDDKSLKYWAAQLIMLLNRYPDLKKFCHELALMVPYKNAVRIGGLFILHQQSFPKELQQLVIPKISKVWAAIQARCEK